MGPDELMDGWRRGLRISHRAHYEAAKHYRHLHLALSLPAVVISALLGTSVFAVLHDSSVLWVKAMLAVLSVTTVVLTSLQAALRFGERSERHNAAAVQIGEVRRALEQQLVFSHRDEPTIETLRKQWNAADRQAPTIPSRIYNRAASIVHGLGDRQSGNLKPSETADPRHS
jgi:hypothetical protein